MYCRNYHPLSLPSYLTKVLCAASFHLRVDPSSSMQTVTKHRVFGSNGQWTPNLPIRNRPRPASLVPALSISAQNSFHLTSDCIACHGSCKTKRMFSLFSFSIIKILPLRSGRRIHSYKGQQSRAVRSFYNKLQKITKSALFGRKKPAICVIFTPRCLWKPHCTGDCVASASGQSLPRKLLCELWKMFTTERQMFDTVIPFAFNFLFPNIIWKFVWNSHD